MALYLHARSISPFRGEGVTATDYIIFFDIKASLSAPRRKESREGAAVSRATLMCASVDRIGYLRVARARGEIGVCTDRWATLGYTSCCLIVTIVWIAQ